MILNFNEIEVESIMFDLIDNLMLLANHNKGLCVIKKVIQIRSKKEKYMKKIISIIVDNALALVYNPYGNYVIQTALEVI